MSILLVLNRHRVWEAGVGALKGRWDVLKRQAFPPGAITFHLGTWSQGEFTGLDRDKAAEVMCRHGFSALYLIHGNAMEVGGRTTLIVGPPGVGKSTVCRRLVRTARARLLEDGLVLVGRRDSDWQVLETGTVDVLRRASVIAKWVRRLALIRRTPYYSPDARVGRVRAFLYNHVIDVAAFRLSVLLCRRSDHDFHPRQVEVDRIVLVDHPLRRSFSYTVVDGELVPLLDLTKAAPRRVEISQISSVGTPSGVKKAIIAAVLAGGGPMRAIA